MATVIAGITTSVDGHVAGPNDGPGKGLGILAIARPRAPRRPAVAVRNVHRVPRSLTRGGEMRSLQPTAYRLSLADGAPSFAEREALDDGRTMGCFYVLDVDDAEQVEEWAAKIPLVGPGGFERSRSGPS
jgi:hypothetical protein